MLGNPAMRKLRDNLTWVSRHIPLHLEINFFRDPDLLVEILRFAAAAVAFQRIQYVLCTTSTMKPSY